ncbi:protein TolR [Fundidesulfovibrio agrisoli]|uniref:protein TolR n=1 Tax=Fundidesulfovibrio agrisoli TaxID=2922717 RepID=UPI001FAB6F7A|nr:protein TolR [Fundidesulfovibrio agrisoli]
MGMSTGGGGEGFLAEINVTPFVDVMLVLLIIFMVTAPMMTQGLEVDLPQTKAVTTLPKDSENIVLTIKKEGTLHIDEYTVTMDELPGHIKRLVTDQKKLMFLRADKEVPYGLVVQVMGVLKTAGVDKLGVVAEPDAPAKEEKTQARQKK